MSSLQSTALSRVQPSATLAPVTVVLMPLARRAART